MAFYSFDTSSLLNGRRDLLPPTTFPTLWSNIEAMIADGHIRCVDVVRDELSRREDDVHHWARSQPGLFVPLSGDAPRGAASNTVPSALTTTWRSAARGASC